MHDSSEQRLCPYELLANFLPRATVCRLLGYVVLRSKHLVCADNAKRFYDLFIPCLVYSLQTKLLGNECRNPRQNLKSRFRSVLPEAEGALGKACLAAKIVEAAKANDLDDVENMAEQALKEVGIESHCIIHLTECRQRGPCTANGKDVQVYGPGE